MSTQTTAPDKPEHFWGCHPEDGASAREAPSDAAKAGEPEPCWHCTTMTSRGCLCDDCVTDSDVIPPTAMYHCPTCGRWWAYMQPRITTLIFPGL